MIGLGQRVLGMKDGRMMGELVGKAIEEEAIMQLATAEEAAA